MDLLNLVQTVIEISKSREEYSEEAKKMRIQLDTLCQSLQDLDDNMYCVLCDDSIPKQLHNKIKSELEEASQMMQKLPEKAGIMDAVRSKLPFMNSLQNIRDKQQQLQELSQMLSHYLIGHIVIQQSKKIKLANGNAVVVEQTQVDANQIEEQDQGDGGRVQIQLKLIADEQVKNAFRSKLLNLCEVADVKFGNTDEKVVYKFGRQQYAALSKEVQQIETISGEHASIICKRTLKPKQQKSEQFVVPLPKQSQQPQPEQQQHQSVEIFYTCSENVMEEQKQVDHEYDYQFYLQNLGKMGVFIYRDCPEKSDNEIGINKWDRIQGTMQIKLNQQDKIGILMKKPDYKQILIAYEFTYRL